MLLQHIPTYMYVLFFVLLYIGIKRCFTRTMSVSRLLLAPILFVALSIHSAINLFGIQAGVLLGLTLGGLIGIFLGYQLVSSQQVKIYPDTHQIQIPGNVFMLVLVMLIFFIEFFIHYAVDAHWPILNHASAIQVAIGISGSIAGLSIGRNLNYYLKFKRMKLGA